MITVWSRFMGIETIDVVIMLVYLLVLVAAGFYAGGRVKDSEDYALAGRSLPKPVLIGTFLGSTIGAAATMGKAGKAYELGYSVLFASMAYFIGYLCMAFLAPKLRLANISSLPDVLERRFGSGMRLMAAFILLTAVMGIFGAQLIACGLIASSLLVDIGVSYEEAILVAAVVIVLYTLVGGLLAVAYTDMIQVLIMLLGIGLLLPVLLINDLGGISSSIEAMTFVPSDTAEPINWGYVLAFIPTYLAFVLIDPGTWQRIAAAKNVQDLRPAMLTTAAIYGLWSVLVVVLGVVALNVLPELSSSDSAIPELILSYMPPAIKGLCLASILAIIMSTADTSLLIAGTTFSQDVVKVIRPQTESKTLLKISRVFILVCGVLGTIFALGKSSLFELNLIVLAVFVSGLFAPVMGALFLKKVDRVSALASSISGVVVTVGLYVMRFLNIIDLPVEPILIGLTISGVVLVVLGWLNASERNYKLPVLLSHS